MPAFTDALKRLLVGRSVPRRRPSGTLRGGSLAPTVRAWGTVSSAAADAEGIALPPGRRRRLRPADAAAQRSAPTGQPASDRVGTKGSS